eukprot:TRINITY_DN3820_c0_g5_i1.p1 TRINITY_DN3820_c0_g5~~TRINITY_DN3820_c0_g5_i1.p1  ORF type:complete len:211 (+),score=36.35 TRINITY_DN3820_c0_g5_i1:127-759(+)
MACGRCKALLPTALRPSMQTRNYFYLSTSRPHMAFDTFKIIRRLESEGFTTLQAESLARSVLDVTQQSTERISTQFGFQITLDEAIEQHRLQIQQIRQELDKLITQNQQLYRHQIGASSLEVEARKSQIKYEMRISGGDMKLEVAGEFAQIQEDINKLDAKLDALEKRFQKDLFDKRVEIDTFKSDIIQFSVATALSLSALALGMAKILF